MDIFTVSLFGHREIEDLRKLDDTLTPIIKELIKTKAYVVFLIGRNGEFDEYSASIIKRAKRDFPNSELTLVLPYEIKALEYLKNYYDSILIPDSIQGVHPKSAITIKNQKMIEMSDLVIVYVGRKKGGAYNALRYAERLGKRIINIFDKDT